MIVSLPLSIVFRRILIAIVSMTRIDPTNTLPHFWVFPTTLVLLYPRARSFYFFPFGSRCKSDLPPSPVPMYAPPKKQVPLASYATIRACPGGRQVGIPDQQFHANKKDKKMCAIIFLKKIIPPTPFYDQQVGFVGTR